MEHEPDDLKIVCFGSTQERKHFPHYCAPDRLGNDLAPIRGAPNRGPGCYNYEQVTCLEHQLERRPMSKKGYIMGARTAPRFPKDNKMQTPSPAEYQSFWSRERTFSPSYAPFNLKAVRFPDRKTDDILNPSPGTYEHATNQGRKVSWPGRFGSPEIPSLEKRTLRSELMTDQEFRKTRNRVAYLGLYYN
ncbi:ciliary microtubule-associated protein 3 isoform X2 [Engystomops pustulosus]|uniref:ciliary microtubule-associated protein 3 isoform X2 n=1 Tax=Engystomops pustulosus TaxID=76066 RepID=UPI003AFA297D